VRDIEDVVHELDTANPGGRHTGELFDYQPR
jgi:hypothetical protein